MTVATVVVRSHGHVEAEIDNEIVALNIQNGTCYGLNRMGSRIWGLLRTPVPVGQICRQLVSEFDVEPSVCEVQVLDFLEELRAEGMVAVPEDQ